MKLAAYPKAFEQQIAGDRSLSLFCWIEMARALDADGLELYDGFLESHDIAYLDDVGEALERAGFAMPMMCCSPNFTVADADERRRAVERHVANMRVTRHLGGPGAVCRVLSGQRYPDVDLSQGVERVAQCIRSLLPVAEELDIVLGLENHYKDGFWEYPEFAQKMDVFLELLAAIPDSPHFGVQYDPSNAIVAGDDPLELLRAVAPRVVSMHASDRWLAEGTTLEELRLADGTLGYSPNLRHGVTGKGMNDYPAIMQILADHAYSGWISIEDGVNGLDEMQESLRFLRELCRGYFGEEQ